MKGIIFNIAEEFLIEHLGEDGMEDLMDTCGLETKEPFIGPGTYPDADLTKIIVAASNVLSLEVGVALKTLGRYTFAKLVERHPKFTENYTHPKNFLKTVESIIHMEVRKLYDGTSLPIFQYKEPSDKELIITYYSRRKLYALMEGLIDGVGDYFGVNMQQTHTIYKHNGVELCDFHLIFEE